MYNFQKVLPKSVFAVILFLSSYQLEAQNYLLNQKSAFGLKANYEVKQEDAFVLSAFYTHKGKLTFELFYLNQGNDEFSWINTVDETIGAGISYQIFNQNATLPFGMSLTANYSKPLVNDGINNYFGSIGTDLFKSYSLKNNSTLTVIGRARWRNTWYNLEDFKSKDQTSFGLGANFMKNKSYIEPVFYLDDGKARFDLGVGFIFK